MGDATVRTIVEETCDCLWEKLKDKEMPQLTHEALRQSAIQFYKTWQFPHCMGAIDGKHVTIQCPPRSGSEFFNYKKTFSIVLQAVVDADGNFMAVDVGDSGRHSDGGVLKHSSFGRALLNNEIPIPEPEAIGNITLPYVFVGDEAYPLRTNLLPPYPGRGLNDTRRVYNYTSRARRQVECGFGMLVNRWAVMKSRINMSPERVTKVVLACCILHNHVR